jgi:hypothetical protein
VGIGLFSQGMFGFAVSQCKAPKEVNTSSFVNK